MARTTFKDLTSAIRAPYLKRFGLKTTLDGVDYGYSNDFVQKWSNAADTGDIDVLRVDSDDKIRLGEEVMQPFRQSYTFNLAKNGSLTDQCFFIAPYAMTIVGITEIHAVAGNDAGTVTLNITHETGTTAPAAGNSVMSGTFNMKGTANTLQTATLTSTASDLVLAAGDRLSANFTGTLTTLSGVSVTITFTPGGKGEFAAFQMQANGDLSDQVFFIANRRMKVSSIQYVHSTAGTNGSAVNVQVTKDTGTDVPGGGTDLLTNNSDAGFNCKGTINTVQTGTLTATEASLWLNPGDRLAVDFAGTLTALAGVVIVVTFTSIYKGYKNVTFRIKANGDLVDQSFFIADRSYYVEDIRQLHSTAGNDGGAVNLQVTADRLTNAPGAGSDLVSLNTNAGFDLKATADTVQIATFISDGLRYITAGDRLSVDFAGTLTTLAGVVVTATLRPV